MSTRCICNSNFNNNFICFSLSNLLMFSVLFQFTNLYSNILIIFIGNCNKISIDNFCTHYVTVWIKTTETFHESVNMRSYGDRANIYSRHTTQYAVYNARVPSSLDLGNESAQIGDVRPLGQAEQYLYIQYNIIQIITVRKI